MGAETRAVVIRLVAWVCSAQDWETALVAVGLAGQGAGRLQY